MKGVTWDIHGVIDTKRFFEDRDAKEYPHMGNYHTHGLNKYNNHRELCIVLELPPEKASKFLNEMGSRIANGTTVFTEGIRTDVLRNSMDVQFITFDDDPTLYIIFPDENGRLPSDADCEEPFKYQYEYARMISEDKGYV